MIRKAKAHVRLQLRTGLPDARAFLAEQRRRQPELVAETALAAALIAASRRHGNVPQSKLEEPGGGRAR